MARNKQNGEAGFCHSDKAPPGNAGGVEEAVASTVMNEGKELAPSHEITASTACPLLRETTLPLLEWSLPRLDHRKGPLPP